MPVTSPSPWSQSPSHYGCQQECATQKDASSTISLFLLSLTLSASFFPLHKQTQSHHLFVTAQTNAIASRLPLIFIIDPLHHRPKFLTSTTFISFTHSSCCSYCETCNYYFSLVYSLTSPQSFQIILKPLKLTIFPNYTKISYFKIPLLYLFIS